MDYELEQRVAAMQNFCVGSLPINYLGCPLRKPTREVVLEVCYDKNAAKVEHLEFEISLTNLHAYAKCISHSKFFIWIYLALVLSLSIKLWLKTWEFNFKEYIWVFNWGRPIWNENKEETVFNCIVDSENYITKIYKSFHSSTHRRH